MDGSNSPETGLIQSVLQAEVVFELGRCHKTDSNRASLNRLLNENDTSLTLTTLAGAAAVLGRRIKLELAPV